MVQALIVRFDHDNIPIATARHAFWFAEVSLRHLPGKQEGTVGRKLLHPASHINDVKVVLSIHRDRARLIEFTDADAPAANDLNATEELAGERGFDGTGLGIAAGQEECDED